MTNLSRGQAGRSGWAKGPREVGQGWGDYFLPPKVPRQWPRSPAGERLLTVREEETQPKVRVSTAPTTARKTQTRWNKAAAKARRKSRVDKRSCLEPNLRRWPSSRGRPIRAPRQAAKVGMAAAARAVQTAVGWPQGCSGLLFRYRRSPLQPGRMSRPIARRGVTGRRPLLLGARGHQSAAPRPHAAR